MIQTLVEFARRHAVLIATTLILLVLIAIFHEIMQPFVIALIVVYLIDPLVTRMNRIRIKNWRIPRGFAVIVAYLLFLSSVVGICFAFIPSLTNEISTASEALPKFFMRVKDEEIPRLSERIDDLIFRLSRKSPKDIAASIEESQKSLDAALDAAELDIRALPDNDLAKSRPHYARLPSHASTQGEGTGVLFRIRKTSPSTYEFLPGDREIRLESDQKGAFVLKNTVVDAPKTEQAAFNLEREITKAASDFFESSTQYAGSALSFLQNAIAFVINAFVQLILVFMLAAFISIDSPRLMSNIRELFENKEGEAERFDEFKNRLARGLSGVVRGQLIICCINGTLTGLGLWIFNVDFSLLLGFIAGLLSVVPIFGTIISTIPAVLLGLIQGPIVALLVLAWILVVHFIDTNFFTPKIVGSSANLHPVVIIFALLAGQFAAGVLGLVLAVPTASVIQTTITFILESTQKTRSETQVKTLSTSSMGWEAVPPSRVGYRVMTTASDWHASHPDLKGIAPHLAEQEMAKRSLVREDARFVSAAKGKVAQSAEVMQDASAAGGVSNAAIGWDAGKARQCDAPAAVSAVQPLQSQNIAAPPVDGIFHGASNPTQKLDKLDPAFVRSFLPAGNGRRESFPGAGDAKGRKTQIGVPNLHSPSNATVAESSVSTTCVAGIFDDASNMTQKLDKLDPAIVQSFQSASEPRRESPDDVANDDAVASGQSSGEIDTTQASAIIDLDESKTQEISTPESLAAVFNAAKKDASARQAPTTAADSSKQNADSSAHSKSVHRSKKRPTIHKGT